MPDHKYTYQQQAHTYEALISREDYQGNILKTLLEISDLNGIDVVETGTGTGRLSCMLAPLVKSITAFDLSKAMIQIAQEKLKMSNAANWLCGVADHRNLPVPNHSADLILSGWSVCYLATWGDDNWQTEVFNAIKEFKRILKPGGKVLLIESLGTGETEPNPPEKLRNYLQFLETQGFTRKWVRTDYKFSSAQEKNNLIGFFFGQDMLKATLPENLLIIPECTGFWVLKK